jgi:pimeloyl-ACP methyl ester carboxylesterase
LDVSVHESIVNIGRPIPLVGVLTEPEVVRNENAALILLNSGIMHRVGACRLSVSIARTVAENGLLSLRFDFSGVGESEPRRAGGIDFDQAAVAEVIEVMDYLQVTRKIRRFIIYGLCSGALVACRTAELDDRVIAVAQIDGSCYPTFKSYAGYYMQRLYSVPAWRARLARWLGLRDKAKHPGSVLIAGSPDFEVPEFAEDPGREAVVKQLKALMENNTKLHCVFTGSEPYFRYREQYRECFGQVNFGANLSVDYYPRASHIFTEPLYQREMVTGLVKWIDGLM